MKTLKINKLGSTPLPIEIARVIRTEVERGALRAGNQLPSINGFNRQYKVARDTVEKAYRELKKQQIIVSVRGKGYFVTGGATKMKVLLVFNKLSSYKKNIYYGLVNTLGKKANVDLHIHHYDISTLEDILQHNIGSYHYYVIMPHFLPGTSQGRIKKVLDMVPPGQLLLLDKDVPEARGEYMAVYQDFKNDIYEALTSASDLLERYQKICVVFPPDGKHPFEILQGIRKYGRKHRKQVAIVHQADEKVIDPGTVFIVVYESGLSLLVKNIRKMGYTPGVELGIISFNETDLKELLGITVVSTDFEKMGIKAAELLQNKEYRKMRNVFTLIRRKSL